MGSRVADSEIMEEEGMETESMEAPETGIQDLPVEIRDYLTSFLDYSSRRACRLVCHTLKESVDNVGVSIKIDIRQPESIELCRTVNATEVQVQNMACPPNPVLNLNKWRTVILSGPIDSNWLNTRLQRNCPNLRVLIITGDCLTSPLFDGPLDLPIFEHLTQLRFNENYASKQDWRVGFPRLQKNMDYLLLRIRSRVLRALDIFACSSLKAPGLSNPKTPKWQLKTLFDFISNHPDSLEELNTANLGIQRNQRRRPWAQFNEEQEVYQIPMTLKQICWSVDQSYNTVLSSFWRNLLSCQESLERLSLEDADTFWFPLERIMFSNARTLKVIFLHLQSTQLLDMSLFTNLEVLQKITIHGRTQDWLPTTVINLNQLPRTRLTCLNLTRVQIEEGFDAVEFIDGRLLETLKLSCLSAEGRLSSRIYLLSFVKLVLRCRSLNALDLTFRPHRSTLSTASGTFTWLEEKAGLNLWLANLSAQGPMNHFCTRFDITDFQDLPDTPLKIRRAIRSRYSLQYMEQQSGNFNVDYLELIAKQGRQPFNFPRNAESYTISRIPRNYSHFRILPNSQPYTMRVNDLGRICITLDFYIEKSVEAEALGFRPVSLADLENGNFPI